MKLYQVWYEKLGGEIDSLLFFAENQEQANKKAQKEIQGCYDDTEKRKLETISEIYEISSWTEDKKFKVILRRVK